MVKDDYDSCGPQLRAALEKMAGRYNAAKAKSIPALTSFFYNMNPGTNPLVHDPQVIPACKVRAISKKKHNLSQN
ncbi:21823_t:CDS:2, partial [Gigaspora rosea]